MGDVRTKNGTTLKLSWVTFERHGTTFELARLMLSDKFHAYLGNYILS